VIQKNFDAITNTDVDTLIANEVIESKILEYKQELPGTTDGDRKEFLADVSSFANASGGDIIYGIKAAVDESGNKTGAPERVVPIEGVTADEAKLRLEETIRNGIDPRLRVQIKEVTGWGEDGQGFVVLIRISKSFASPHMVTYKGTSKFYSRHSSGKYPLDVHEIRSAFLATDSQAERIKRFRQDRLGQIIADETPVKLSSPHRLVLHVIPIASFLNNERLHLPSANSLISEFQPISHSAYGHRHNLDGFLTYSTGNSDGGHFGYCQLFFDGSVEAVYSDVLRFREGRPFLPSIGYEQYLIRSAGSYLSGLKKLGLLPPVDISLALLGCKGSCMGVDEWKYDVTDRHPIDRDPVILPDIVIEDLEADVPQMMKPILDAIWNACGFSRDLNYDDDGNRNLR